MAFQHAQAQQTTESSLITGTWNDVFPVNVERQDQSFDFVKKLLNVGLSNILYLRSSWPESAFENRNIDGLKLKLLRRDSNQFDEVVQFCYWIEAATEAIEKSYLRELVLAIYLEPDEPENAIETYTFQFEYFETEEGKQQVAMKVCHNDIEKTRTDNVLYKRTILLFRQLLLTTQNLDVLPDDAFITIKLNYYDERTPVDYEPNGFLPGDIDFLCERQVEQPFQTAKVTTKHHGLNVKIRSTTWMESGPAQEVNDVQSRRSHCTQEEAKESNDESIINYPLACPCTGRSFDPNYDLLLACRTCRTKQHGCCFGVMTEEQVPAQHMCHECAHEYGQEEKCTCSKLFGMLQRKKNPKATCIYRRSLFFCIGHTRFLRSELQTYLSVSKLFLEKSLERLLEEGVVLAEEGNERMICNIPVLSKLAPMYLGHNVQAILTRGAGDDPPSHSQYSPMSQLTQVTQSLSVKEPTGNRKMARTSRGKLRSLSPYQPVVKRPKYSSTPLDKRNSL